MNPSLRRWLPFLVGIAVVLGLLVAVHRHGVGGPREGRGAASAEVERAIARGLDYLVASQNKDGSWGGPASNLWDIYAPVPGSFYAFQVGASSLALSGLIDADDDSAPVRAAIAKATDFILTNHKTARRVSPDTLYNVWAHAYALEALARCLARETDEARRGAIRRVCDEAVDLLQRFEFVDGGWGYYNFDLVSRRPEHGATTFTTAAVLVAMRAAADVGIRIPRRLVDRAVALIETCRKPDWSFEYAWDHRFSPSHPINKWNGSLARTPSCAIALDAWGAKVPDAKFVEALERLKAQGRFLQIARKYPFPHETWFYNSGYFCFFGYYYAAMILDHVPEAVAMVHRKSISDYLISTQEQDGSFWDYQLYSYHKAYGTGYVLSTLSRCRPPLPK